MKNKPQELFVTAPHDLPELRQTDRCKVPSI